jgi:two-component system, NarL family, nitrate/nitrite response regulator NarL
MRVALVGRAGDRDRVRRQLIDAGIEVVAESDAAPQPAATPFVDSSMPIDAVVIASPAASRRFGLQEADAALVQEELTPRERDVLALVAEGLSNKTIGATLGISDQTVKFHVAAIIAKLGASNRTDAVRRALRRGLVAI